MNRAGRDGERIVDWYLAVKGLIRALEVKARDALAVFADQGKAATGVLNGYMKADVQQLAARWVARYPNESLHDLTRHVHFGDDVDYRDMVERDLPALESAADRHLFLEGRPPSDPVLGFENLLHPLVVTHCLKLYGDGHLREAVVAGVLALFGLIRERGRQSADGSRLVDSVFSLERPILVLDELETESGRDDQKGFMQLFKGIYQGVRNPKSHRLDHNLNPLTAAQHLVFASLLIRRVEEARIVGKPAEPVVQASSPWE